MASAYDDLAPSTAENGYADLAPADAAGSATPTASAHIYDPNSGKWFAADRNVKAGSPVGGITARGLIEGAASPITFPADVGIGVGNMLNRVSGRPTLDTNASDLLKRGLDKTGLPDAQTTGEKVLKFGANVAGGFGLDAALSTGKAAVSSMRTAAEDIGNWSEAAPYDSPLNKAIGNRAWAKAIGSDADAPTGAAIKEANERLGKAFDFIRSNSRITQFTPDADLKAISDINSSLTPSSKSILNNDVVQRVVATLSRGHANGEELGDLASALGKAGKDAAEQPVAEGLFHVKDIVDKHLLSTLDPEEAALYSKVSQQYKTLWSALAPQRSGNLNLTTGDVDLAAMARYLQRTDTMGFAGANTSPAYEVTRLAQRQVGDQSLMAQVATKGGTLGGVMRLVRSVPQLYQMASKVGLPAMTRWLASHPAGMAAIVQASKQAQDQQQQ